MEHWSNIRKSAIHDRQVKNALLMGMVVLEEMRKAGLVELPVGIDLIYIRKELGNAKPTADDIEAALTIFLEMEQVKIPDAKNISRAAKKFYLEHPQLF